MTAPLPLCLATQNPHKIEELRQLFALHAKELLHRLQLLSLTDLGIADDVVEDGIDFAENARKKAEAAYSRTGYFSLADDSGLEVTALGGAPGLYSARYGGAPRPGQSRDARNREVLLAALQAVQSPQRQARFVCTLCLYGQPPGAAAPIAIFGNGECRGSLLHAEHGAFGFGYDSLFVPEKTALHAADLPVELLGRTYAELSSEQKNRTSHRARALQALLPELRRITAA